MQLDDHEIRITDNETNIQTNADNILINQNEIQAIEDSVGAANGIAPLGADLKVPAINLPSYVDDVEEYADLASFPVTGETGKIYVALDTNKTYRWSGSIYVEISPSDVNSVNGYTGIVSLDKTDIGLSNVTNDAQLKRSANDFTTFPLKTSPVAGDLVLLEDSENSGEKVYADIVNLLVGGGGVPLLAKGSLLTSNGLSNGEITVGTVDQILVADPNETSGVKWSDKATVAIVDPIATDDSYSIGSHWINTTTGSVYICIDNTPTAAVWINLTSSSGGGSVTAPTSILATTGSYTVPTGNFAIIKAHSTAGSNLLINGTTVLQTSNLSWSNMVSSTSPQTGAFNGQRHMWATNVGSAPTLIGTTFSNSTGYDRPSATQSYTVPEGTVITGNCFKLIEVY